jgi:hypothetical protein
MKLVFESYAAEAPIPVQHFVRNRKLVKYFNRETAAALIAARKLFDAARCEPTTPFYYETGIMEFESLGLDAIANGSRDSAGQFDQRRFIETGARAVPPLTQFKALYNMPLSFVAIENGLIGDNAVIYASARGLLAQALAAPGNGPVLLGSGKVYADARVESALALVAPDELAELATMDWQGEAIGMFRNWHARRGHV